MCGRQLYVYPSIYSKRDVCLMESQLLRTRCLSMSAKLKNANLTNKGMRILINSWPTGAAKRALPTRSWSPLHVWKGNRQPWGPDLERLGTIQGHNRSCEVAIPEDKDVSCSFVLMMVTHLERDNKLESEVWNGPRYLFGWLTLGQVETETMLGFPIDISYMFEIRTSIDNLSFNYVKHGSVHKDNIVTGLICSDFCSFE